MTEERPRWGFFGGTFDPPHLGHLRAAEEAAEMLELERVVFVPTAANPLKEEPESAPADRLAMVRAAVRDNDRFHASDTEIYREAPAYTVDTVRQLAADDDRVRWVLLVGADAWATLPAWREPAALLELADVAVFERPGDARPQPAALLADIDPPGGVWYDTKHLDDGWHIEFSDANGLRGHCRVSFLATTPLAISSTAIRDRCRSGHSVRYLTPDPVRQEMEKRGLYGI